MCVTESRAEIRGWTASGRRVSAGGAGHPPPLLSLARVAFAFAVRSEASLESNPLCLAWRGAARRADPSGAEEAAEARSTASSLTSPHARPGAGGENFPVFDTAPTRPEISRSYPGDRRGTDQLGRRQGRAGPVRCTGTRTGNFFFSLSSCCVVGGRSISGSTRAHRFLVTQLHRILARETWVTVDD